MRYTLLIIALLMVGCGDNYPRYEPNYVSEEGLQLYIPEITELHDSFNDVLYAKGEIVNTILYWADERARLWIDSFSEEDAEQLWHTARRQVIAVKDGYRFPCSSPGGWCVGYYYPNNVIEITIYTLEGYILFDGIGFWALPHELCHAIGMRENDIPW